MVDPQVRLQNIAIEAAELQARRQMCWSEASNRGSMFMTVVGATVFGLALLGNATQFGRSFLLLTLLILPVLIFTGVSSLARMGELDRQDGRLVQGLNRLRQLRVQLDPTIEPHLVTSPYDDFMSVLSAYGENNPRLHSLWVLPTLIGAVVALTAGIFVGVLALLLDVDPGTATLIGVVTFVIVVAIMGVIGYRSFLGAMRSIRPMFPAPSPSNPDRSDTTGSAP